MTVDWKQWEGRTIKEEFPLQRFLGGSDCHAVFLLEKTAGGRPQTAIRLLDANSADARAQLQLWEPASKLNHSNLLRIFEAGRCEIEGKDFFYAWTEYGEEELSQILPTRSLTPAETRQILEAVVPALAYLHGQDLVHGSLKPSNIFAVGDTVKISSDTVRSYDKPVVLQAAKSAYDAPEAGEKAGPAADVWSLGVTLVEALTQRLPVGDAHSQGRVPLPDGIPQPFHEIIENCLKLDPGERWTTAQIAARLRAEPATSRGATGAPSPAPSQAPASPSSAPKARRSAKRVYLIAVAAALVIAAVLIARHKPQNPPSEAQQVQEQPGSAAPPGKPNPTVPAQAGSGSNTPPSASPESAGSSRASSDGMLTVDSRDDVLQRVAPRVSPSAQRTITGMLGVRVRLDVDAAGNVTAARLQSAGPSKYFARVALEAAREWKFKPAMVNGQAVPSKWTLRFGFSRRSTEAAAERTEP
jgi:TonB family protein